MNEELQEVIGNNPEWYTNLLLEDAKEFIRSNMASASRSFIAIGYYLKYIKANKLYEQDGYSGIWDFAQNEFNISRTWAGRWMAINDRFSKGGNSPILLDQYTGFSASKLAEMLSLPDDQLEQVTLVTTRAEIRGMKPVKEENCAHAHIIPEPEEILLAPEEPEQTKPLSLSIMGLPKTVYPPDSSMTTAGCGHKYDCYTCHREGCGIRQEDCWCIDAPCGNPFPCDILKNDIDVVEQAVGDSCQFFNLELVDPEWIRAGDKEPVPCCKYCSNQCEYACKRAKQLHKPEPKTQELTVDDLDLSIRTYNLLKRADIHTVNDLTELTETDALHILNVTQKNIDEIKERLAEHGLAFMTEEEYRAEYKGSILDDIPVSANDTLANMDNQAETENDVDTLVAWENNCSNCKYDKMTVEEFKAINHDREHPCLECNNELNYWMPMGEEGEEEQEQVETVEADIIQTVPSGEYDFKKVSQYGLADVKSAIMDRQKNLAAYKDCELDAPIVKLEKMVMDALQALEESMYMHDMPEQEKPEPVQPELPILKNNDQRKAFIEAYETWPIWIDLEQTGERYYRYDFEDGTSFVIRVSLQHVYQNYNRTEKVGYRHEEYFLLGMKNKWIPGMPTFTESSSNKSAMVDHLRELQKKGA